MVAKKPKVKEAMTEARWTHSKEVEWSFRRWIGLSALAIAGVLLLGGCASSGQVGTSSFQEKSQTFDSSKGIQASRARSDAALSVGQSDRKERVMWGGVCLFQTEKSKNTVPVCESMAPSLQEALNKSLTEAIAAGRLKSFDLTGLGTQVADNWISKDALVMVVALTFEQVYTYPSLGKTKVNADVSAEILFVDTKANMQITASYPLGVTVVDLTDGPPDDERIKYLFKAALLGDRKTAEGKALTLEGQVIQTLEAGDAIPRALRAPVAVTAVEFGPEAENAEVLGQPYSIQKTSLDLWSDSLARSFCNFLGYRTGFPVNPYLGGAVKVSSEQSIGVVAQFTMRRVDGQAIGVTLRKPVFNITLKIDKLIAMEAALAESEYGLTKLAYGFQGHLKAVNVDTGKEVLTVPLQVPGDKKTAGNQKLSKLYEEIVTIPILTKNLEGGAINHSANWRNQLNVYIEQLAHEIAFQQDDVGKKFGILRESIQRNALRLKKQWESFVKAIGGGEWLEGVYF